MMRFWKRDREHDFLEARLRDERPGADEELVSRLAEGVPRRPQPAPRLRLATALALTALLIVPVAALGALSNPLEAAKQILTLNQTAAPKGGGSTSSAAARQTTSNTSANNQYQDRVTICHRDAQGRGNTITVGSAAAQNHLQNHPGDTAGPCPPGSRP